MPKRPGVSEALGVGGSGAGRRGAGWSRGELRSGEPAGRVQPRAPPRRPLPCRPSARLLGAKSPARRLVGARECGGPGVPGVGGESRSWNRLLPSSLYSGVWSWYFQKRSEGSSRGSGAAGRAPALCPVPRPPPRAPALAVFGGLRSTGEGVVPNPEPRDPALLRVAPPLLPRCCDWRGGGVGREDPPFLLLPPV